LKGLRNGLGENIFFPKSHGSASGLAARVRTAALFDGVTPRRRHRFAL